MPVENRKKTMPIEHAHTSNAATVYWFGTEAAMALVVQYGSCASKASR
jgi:hypothetical protein